MKKHAGNVLFVVNYPANTGYAWDYFERLFAKVADRLASRGVRTFVAYPSIPSPPQTLEGTSAEAVALDASLDSRSSRHATARFIRERDIRLVYYTDRATCRLGYLALRRAGASHIIAADHTSGGRTPPRGPKRWAKWIRARLPGVNADHVVTPSDYVADRQERVVTNPRQRITRIYYGFPLPREDDGGRPRTHDVFGLDPSRPIVATACRAAPEKGVHHLLRAFDEGMRRVASEGPRPALVYCGDGPQMSSLRALREELEHKEDVILGGYRPGAVSLLRDASFFVVPSVWQDALPLAVMEPMAFGKPVIGSSVGGIPEMIEDGVTGILVPPGDEDKLAGAIAELLHSPDRIHRFGEAARRRVAEKFSPERELEQLFGLIEHGLGL